MWEGEGTASNILIVAILEMENRTTSEDFSGKPHTLQSARISILGHRDDRGTSFPSIPRILITLSKWPL